MIRKTFFLSILALTGFLLVAQTSTVEARGHRCCRGSNTNIRVSVGSAYNDAYVVRRYARPVVIPTAVPVYAPVQVYTPVYVTPAPTYVEEVYVTPAPRPFGFGGLSFSWNFFK